MLDLWRVLVFIILIVFIECRKEQLVVGGKEVDIEQFPHSVFFTRTCYNLKTYENVPSMCSASIINELVILTAAHCVECKDKENYKLGIVSAYVGHAFYYKGFESTVEAIRFHPNYTVFYQGYDIILGRLKTRIEFSKNVKRVAVMSEPPYAERAEVAGWGLSDLKTRGNLKYVEQWVWKRNKCKEVIPRLASGTICASNGDPYRYVARGDSGSALVVRGYIQIGIVSYAIPTISKSVVVYTDTGFFHDWIIKTVETLYCASEP